jgi:phosphogluconate dehydratase
MARAAGVVIDWQDLDELSAAVPLIARVYPNGAGDVNHFHAAGGMGFVMRELLDAGLIHDDVLTVSGAAWRLCAEPVLDGDTLVWRDLPGEAAMTPCCAPSPRPFLPDGGMRLVQGNLGRAHLQDQRGRSRTAGRSRPRRACSRSGRSAGRVQGGRA